MISRQASRRIFIARILYRRRLYIFSAPHFSQPASDFRRVARRYTITARADDAYHFMLSPFLAAREVDEAIIL